LFNSSLFLLKIEWIPCYNLTIVTYTKIEFSLSCLLPFLVRDLRRAATSRGIIFLEMEQQGRRPEEGGDGGYGAALQHGVMEQ
jgi:hypothetical protein